MSKVLHPSQPHTRLLSSFFQVGKVRIATSPCSLRMGVLECWRFLLKPQVPGGKRSSKTLTVSQNLPSVLVPCSWDGPHQMRWMVLDDCLDFGWSLSKCLYRSCSFWCFWSHSLILEFRRRKSQELEQPLAMLLPYVLVSLGLFFSLFKFIEGRWNRGI